MSEDVNRNEVAWEMFDWGYSVNTMLSYRYRNNIS